VTSHDAFNPFRYSAPVEPEDLLDREDESQLLLELAVSAHNSRLSAPRRYGKTSLLRHVLAGAEGEGLNVALVDLYGVVSATDVVLRLRDAYRAFRGPVARRVEGLVGAAALRAGLGPAEVEVAIGRGDGTAEQLLWELLELPREAFERTGARCVVAFDEFQDLLKAGPALDAPLRSRIQHQATAASYVFAGSHEGMLSELFDRRERPLYGQARRVALGPLPEADVASYIAERFDRTRRDPGRALAYLVRLARGHPQRTMLLAHHLWSATPAGESADEETWEAARGAVFAELHESFAASWDGLVEDSDRRVLLALSAGRKLFGRETLERYALTRGSATRARERLLRSGDLLDVDGALVLTDPLFSAWIAAGRRTPEELLS
jgi:hypothetical protein